MQAGAGGITQIAGNDIVNDGARIISGGDVRQQAGGDIRNTTRITEGSERRTSQSTTKR